MPRNDTASTYDQKPGQPSDAAENVHRLTRAPRLEGAEAGPATSEGPSAEQNEQARRASPAAPAIAASQPAAKVRQPKRSAIRTYLFAALPLVLAIGGYVYVTGGAVMPSDASAATVMD